MQRSLSYALPHITCSLWVTFACYQCRAGRPMYTLQIKSCKIDWARKQWLGALCRFSSDTTICENWTFVYNGTIMDIYMWNKCPAFNDAFRQVSIMSTGCKNWVSVVCFWSILKMNNDNRMVSLHRIFRVKVNRNMLLVIPSMNLINDI